MESYRLRLRSTLVLLMEFDLQLPLWEEVMRLSRLNVFPRVMQQRVTEWVVFAFAFLQLLPAAKWRPVSLKRAGRPVLSSRSPCSRSWQTTTGDQRKCVRQAVS